VLYLDKPPRDHNLLQAIARTAQLTVDLGDVLTRVPKRG
jgi:hypothetical protein